MHKSVVEVTTPNNEGPNVAANRNDRNVSEGGAQKQESDPVQMKKSLGFLSSVTMIVGVIIGSGIFISPKGVLLGSGSVGMSLVVWALCGLFSLLGALTYSELGLLIPNFGGTYIYLLEGFAPDRQSRSFWRPLPSFLVYWVFMVSKSASTGLKALVCSEYLIRLANSGCGNWATYDSPEIPVKLIALLIVFMVMVINCYSIRLTRDLQNVLTFTKLAAIALIVAGGIKRLYEGHTAVLESGFEGTNNNVGEVVTGFFSGLWAFNGWQNLNFATKEMKNVERDLRRSIIVSTILVIICYIFLNISYYSALTVTELLASETVAVGFGAVLGGEIGEIVMISVVALSTLGTTVSGIFLFARLNFAAAKEGHTLQVLSHIQKKRLTPVPAVIFHCIGAALLVLPSNIGSLINLIGFCEWIFMGLAMIALVLIRRRNKGVKTNAVKTPMLIICAVFVISVMLVVIPIVLDPKIEYFYIIGYIILGIMTYFIFVYLKKSLPGIDGFSSCCQKLFEAVPSDLSKDS